VRDGPRPLIALVQRRKDDGWVLPKGKLKGKEDAIAAARREVIEETGHAVSVHEYLGAISYKAGGGKPKVVEFYRMEANAEPSRKPARDIKAVRWLPLESAVAKLSLPLEQAFLRNIGPRALKGAKPAAAPAERPEEPVRPQPSIPAPDAPMQRAGLASAAPSEPLVPNATVHADAVPAVAAPARKNFLQLIFGAFTQRRPEAR
jgi:8-oxo-dGTP diphosphatase